MERIPEQRISLKRLEWQGTEWQLLAVLPSVCLHRLASEGDSSDNSAVVWGERSAPGVHLLCILSVRNPDTCVYTETKQAVVTTCIRHKNSSCVLGSSPGSMWGLSPITATGGGLAGSGYPPLPPYLASSKLFPFHPAEIAISVTPFLIHCFLLFQELEGGTPDVLSISAAHGIGSKVF